MVRSCCSHLPLHLFSPSYSVWGASDEHNSCCTGGTEPRTDASSVIMELSLARLRSYLIPSSIWMTRRLSLPWYDKKNPRRQWGRRCVTRRKSTWPTWPGYWTQFAYWWNFRAIMKLVMTVSAIKIKFFLIAEGISSPHYHDDHPTLWYCPLRFLFSFEEARPTRLTYVFQSTGDKKLKHLTILLMKHFSGKKSCALDCICLHFF